MKTLVARVKRYLSHPQTGAGLLYATLAIWLFVAHGRRRCVAVPGMGAEALSAAGAQAG